MSQPKVKAMPISKTLKQEAAQALRRSAGQYNRHGRRSVADELREIADKLEGKDIDHGKTWESEEVDDDDE